MKKLLALLLLFGIVGCSPFPEDIAKIEKENTDIAISTCNLIKESLALDGVMRLREINVAREKMEKKLFLGTDRDILVSIRYDLCSLLVLDDSLYDSKLKEKKENEARREEARERRKAAATITKDDFEMYLYRIGIFPSFDKASELLVKINNSGYMGEVKSLPNDKNKHAVYVIFFSEEEIKNNKSKIHEIADIETGVITPWMP
tara:strand:+ start:715 stop:1326 length:612 start_codon:yes stop_codon:yes gene_type:complete